MNPESANSSKRGDGNSSNSPYRNRFYWNKSETTFNPYFSNRIQNRNSGRHGPTFPRFSSVDSHVRNRDSRNNRFQRYPHFYPDGKLYHYNNERDFSNQRYNTPKDHRDENKHRRTDPKKVSRETSPVQGSEEYMNRKIQKTSALIMRQLLTPGEAIPELNSSQQDDRIPEENTLIPANRTKKTKTSKNKKVDKKTSKTYDVMEIHDKIMGHIMHLNDGKKKNLINNTVNTGYDEIIQNIQKKKQLEISRALRSMCAVESSMQVIQETSNIIDSIIPDLGIKIEELPRDVIEELSRTLNCDFEGEFDRQIYPDEVELGVNSNNDSANDLSEMDSAHFKLEPIDQEDNYTLSESSNSQQEMPHQTSLLPIPLSTATVKQEEYNEQQNYQENTGGEILEENNTVINTEETEHPLIESENIKKEFDDNVHSCMEIDKTENVLSSTESVYDEVDEMCTVKQEEEEEILQLNQLDDFSVPVEDRERVQSNSLETNSDEVNLVSKILENELDLEIEKVDDLEKTKKQAETSEKSVQTEECCTQVDFLNRLLEHLEENIPQTLEEKVNRMFWIDDCISKLTKYRKSLFEHYDTSKETPEQEKISGGNVSVEITSEDKRVLKKRKRKGDLPEPETPKTTCRRDGSDDFVTPKRPDKKVDTTQVYDENFVTPKKSTEVSNVDSDTVSVISEEENEVEVEAKGLAFQQNILEFRDVHEKMLVLKRVEDHLLAASESGKIYYCSLEDGSYTQILEVTTSPITSLHISNVDNITYMFVGSFDSYFRIYSWKTSKLVKSMRVEDEIQCMEEQWGYIFFGCRNGTLVRYSIKKQKFEYQEKILPTSILVLKATQEGSRRVLIMGSRMQPVVVRDAMSGLYMRELDFTMSPTIYCLLLEQHLVYCGTTSDNILVISFHEGKVVHKYAASKFKGISGMKMMGNLLFSSCLDGNIYVYDVSTKVFIDVIKGPGGVILSMEVLENQIIVGTMSFQFKAIPIPVYILRRRQLNNK